MDKLIGWRTYLSAAAIILHQISKAFGYDIPDTMFSGILDGILSIAVIVFRKKAIVYTPK